MMRLGRGLALAVLLGVTLVATPARAADDDEWLLGRWELVRSPDGDPTDRLEFAPDGRLTVITPNLKRLGGRYELTGREVLLNFKIGNESILITLTYGPDKAKLYARSARTGNTAVYEKRP
jgi:uncharacterized protein (TIGR03066 family)